MFFLDIHQHAGVVDTSGRPLDELPGPHLPSHVEFQLRTCPWPGSRHLHARPMNVSALEAMVAHWDALMARLRGASLAAGIPGHGAALVRVMHAVGTIAVAPLLVRRMGRDVVDEEAALAHKLVVGIQGALHAWSLDQHTPPTLETESFLAFVEERGLLVGGDQVCAGPPHLMKETMDALLAPLGRSVAPSQAELDAGALMAAVHVATMAPLLGQAGGWERASQAQTPASWAHTLHRLTQDGFPPLRQLVSAAARTGGVEALQQRLVGMGKELMPGVDAAWNALLAPGPVGVVFPRVAQPWRDVLLETLAHERALLGVLEMVERRAPAAPGQRVQIPEGLHLGAWMGPSLRDVAEVALRKTIQVTPKGVYVLG